MAYTTIKKPSDYFNTKLYTGNGSTQSITGVGHQPDFVWLKQRSSGVYYHRLQDSVRGAGKPIYSNRTDAEGDFGTGTTGSIRTFDTDGFSIGSELGTNANNVTMVSWNWKANGAGSANNDGNVASTVSANTTAGFSIVKWSGTTNNKTIGHGLGTVPAMVIAKNYGGSGTNWIVYHKNLTSGYFLKLNLTNAQDNANSYFTADPTNSILSLTGNTAMNSSGNNMIAYCFAEKTGYSKFGSYTGNGNADGTFVYTGFKPAFLILKRADSTSQWKIIDNKRLGYNPSNSDLYADSEEVENATTQIDLLSNGFKIKVTSATLNSSGGSYIYMAFAEEPLVGDNPATAR